MNSSATQSGSWDATDKQMQFIHTLEAERGLPLTTSTLKKKEASARIDALLDMPKAVSTAPVTPVADRTEDKLVGETDEGEPIYRTITAPQAADAEAEVQFESEMIGREEAEVPFAALGEPDKLVGKRVAIAGSVYAIVATNTGTGLATLQRVSGKPNPLLGERGRIERSIAKGLIA